MSGLAALPSLRSAAHFRLGDCPNSGLLGGIRCKEEKLCYSQLWHDANVINAVLCGDEQTLPIKLLIWRTEANIDVV